MHKIWYEKRKNFIENEIKNYLEKNLFSENIFCLKYFKEALIYALEWWKKLRAILALEFYLSLKNISFENFFENKEKHKDIILYCLALEIIHAYSLVHDDLPCMDNDELRRWKPTVWKKFGEWKAVLVWDNLNSFAFEIISEMEKPIFSQKIAKLLSKSVWFSWMIWGQVMDLYFEENFEKLDFETLKKLHNKKTAKLIEASILWGIILSEKEENLEKFRDFWKNLWLAFQIKDDILDVEWDEKKVWKSIWNEEKWFVYFLWLQESKNELENILEKCIFLIKDLKSENILELVNFIGKREE